MDIRTEERDTVPPDWIDHPHTKRVVRQFNEELAQARLTLASCARKSPDAEVREAGVHVVQLERFLGQLTGRVGTGAGGGMQ